MMNTKTAFILIFFISIFGLVDSSCTKYMARDIDGRDTSNVRCVHNSAEKDCCSICRRTAGCKAYTWSDYRDGTCWLKSVTEPLIPKHGTISGILPEDNAQCLRGSGVLVPAVNPYGGVQCEFACYIGDTCDVTVSFFGDCQEFNDGNIHVGGKTGIPPMEKIDSFRFCEWTGILTEKQRPLVHFQASKFNENKFVLSEFYSPLDGWGCGDICVTAGTGTIIAFLGKISENTKNNG